jgi:hypothetical protein
MGRDGSHRRDDLLMGGIQASPDIDDRDLLIWLFAESEGGAGCRWSRSDDQSGGHTTEPPVCGSYREEVGGWVIESSSNDSDEDQRT